MIGKKTHFKKYLSLLEIEEVDPSLELLKKIVKAHLIKVPFENVSKLLFKQQGMTDIPDLKTFLEGIEQYNFGGTCYTNNYYLYLFLEHVGYNIKLCGADMKNPDVHLISIVNIDGHEYIIDGGYAAPFQVPLPADLRTDFIITLGNEKYIVKPKDENGRIKVEQHYNGKLQHWYTVNPQPRKIEDFRKVIADSYSNSAVFMNAIRITRFNDGGVLVLKNLLFIEISGSQTFTIKLTRNELPGFVEKRLGIPANLVGTALASVKDLKDFYD